MESLINKWKHTMSNEKKPATSNINKNILKSPVQKAKQNKP